MYLTSPTLRSADSTQQRSTQLHNCSACSMGSQTQHSCTQHTACSVCSTGLSAGGTSATGVGRGSSGRSAASDAAAPSPAAAPACGFSSLQQESMSHKVFQAVLHDINRCLISMLEMQMVLQPGTISHTACAVPATCT